jgi:hypothetical protein
VWTSENRPLEVCCIVLSVDAEPCSATCSQVSFLNASDLIPLSTQYPACNIGICMAPGRNKVMHACRLCVRPWASKQGLHRRVGWLCSPSGNGSGSGTFWLTSGESRRHPPELLPGHCQGHLRRYRTGSHRFTAEVASSRCSEIRRSKGCKLSRSVAAVRNCTQQHAMYHLQCTPSYSGVGPQPS